MTGTFSPSGIGTVSFYPTQTSAGAGIAADINLAPGSTNAPIFYEPSAILTNGAAVLWMIATGAASNWGGCQVWMSVDGGSSYGRVGTIVRGGVQGLLTATLPSHADPDTTNTLSVNLTMSQASLISGSMIDADLLLNLCYVDGELVSFQTATLTSAFNYDLTYLRRGAYSSPIGSHASDSQFGRFSQTTFRQEYPSNLVGTTIHVKLPAFNLFGSQLQDLSTVSDYTYTLTGNGLSAGGGGGLVCAVDVALAAGCSMDWGVLGSPICATCDWGFLGDGRVGLTVDTGVIGE